MKETIEFVYDSLNKCEYEALVITPEQLGDLLDNLPDNIELEYDEEFSKNYGKSIYCMMAHGKEPLGMIQQYLEDTIKIDWKDLPKDIGYDSDSDGVGYNGIFLKLSDS